MTDQRSVRYSVQTQSSDLMNQSMLVN